MATGSSFYITIPQLVELQARFDMWPEQYKTILAKTLEKAAIGTQSIMMSQVPVRTGHLRQSIGYVIKGSEAVVAVDPKLAPYAFDVEAGTGVFGTHGTVIQPQNKSVMATKMNPGWGSANSSGYFIIGTYQRGQEANKFMVRSRALAFPVVQMTFKEAGQLLTGSLAD
jgi:hypothetical protein